MRKALTAAAALAAAATIAAATAGSPLVFIAKPVAMGALVVATLAALPLPSERYRGLIAAGLVCSLAGDVLLLFPEKLFALGLLAFLAAHLCYLSAFRTDGGEDAPLGLLLPVAAVGLTILAFLWGGLNGLRLPVVVYVAAIVTMCWSALGRWWRLRTPSAGLAAAGAVAFVVSDGVLAINRFRSPLPLAALLVLGTYYPAQFLLAASVGRTSGGSPAAP